MSIEWDKVEKKPDSGFKVPGQYLLDQRRKVNDLENTLQATSTQLNKVKSDLDNSNTKNAELTGLFTQLKGSYDTLEKEKLILEQMKSELEKQLADVTTERNNFEREKLELIIARKELDGQVNTLHGEIVTKDQQIVKLEKAREKELGNAGELGSKLSNAENRIRDLESSKAQVEGHLAELQAKLDAAIAKIAELTNSINAKDTMIQERELQLSSQAQLSSQSQYEKAQWQGKIQELMTAMGHRDLKMADMEKLVTQLKDLLNKKEELLIAKEQDLTRLIAEKEKEMESNFAQKQKDLDVRKKEITSHISSGSHDVAQLEAKLSEKSQKLQELEAKVKELEPSLPSTGSYGMETRIICPMCSSVEIKHVEDKTRVLSYIGHMPMYAKKNQCRKCGYEW
jgi:chromosome segregation ATPase